MLYCEINHDNTSLVIVDRGLAYSGPQCWDFYIVSEGYFEFIYESRKFRVLRPLYRSNVDRYPVTAGNLLKRGHCACLWLHWYNGQYQSTCTSLTRPHLLLAGNDTVLMSMWHSGGMHSTERPVRNHSLIVNVINCTQHSTRKLKTFTALV